jgi:predicted DNA-binding helix-hairpin-helix protein
MELTDKLEILADAAKYGASCAGSGATNGMSICRLTVDFYLRNYIDGLFLGSGIIRLADYTMEQLVHIARQLGEVHNFRGYILLFIIPAGYTPAGGAAFSEVLRCSLAEAPQQVNLWPELQAA